MSGRNPGKNGRQPAFKREVGTPPGMKRSTKVTLALAGSAALAVYVLGNQPRCDQADPANPQPCPSRSSSSSGRWHSYGSSSSSATSSQSVTSRGGFGSTGSSFSFHGGG